MNMLINTDGKVMSPSCIEIKIIQYFQTGQNAETNELKSSKKRE